MTIPWSDIRFVHVALGVAMVAVWGILLYRVTAHLTVPGDEPSGPPETASWTMPPEGARPSSVPYTGQFRDPFEPPGASSRRSTSAPDPPSSGAGQRVSDRPEPQPAQPPAQSVPTGPLLRGHTLIGVVDQTAMVREPSQRLRFLQTGAIVGGVSIVDVQPTYLIMQKNERTDTLRIDS